MTSRAADLLSNGGWAPSNRERLLRFMQETGMGSAGYDPQRPPVAVFDWDNTCIFNDVGNATFYFQARTLHLKLMPGDLHHIVPDRSRLKKNVSFASEKRELLANYRLLYDAAVAGEKAIETPWSQRQVKIRRDAKLLNAYQAVQYRLLWFYARIDGADGTAAAYTFVTRFYTNLTSQQVKRLVEMVLNEELRDPQAGQRCTIETITYPSSDPAAAQATPPLTIKRGLVTNPEMKALMTALRSVGFDVYVVSATFQPTVATMAFRYGVFDNRVIGIRLASGPDGAFHHQPLTPIPYRQGKVESVRHFIGRDPVFIAGDSDGDLDLMKMSGVRLRLIIDRRLRTEISAIYEKARHTDPDHYLLQGRHDYDASGSALGTWNGSTCSAA